MNNYNADNAFSSISALHKLMLKGGIKMTDKKEIKLIIGANIKREREKAGYTQNELSELIGIESKSPFRRRMRKSRYFNICSDENM